MCWLFCVWNEWIWHWEALSGAICINEFTPEVTPLIFSWWFSPVALHHLDCNRHDTIWASPAASIPSDQVRLCDGSESNEGWNEITVAAWRAFTAGDPAKSFPTARRGGPLHAKHFSACVSSLPVSHCVITSWLEVFIKKLEPLAEARQPPLFCAKLDTSTSPSSSCIHVRKSKSSISLECLQCMYITQQQRVC